MVFDNKEYNRAYRQRPEAKLRRKEYMAIYNNAIKLSPKYPEMLARKKAYEKTYLQRPEVRARRNQYNRERRRRDIQFAIAERVKSRVRLSLKKYGLGKNQRTNKYEIDIKQIYGRVGAPPQDGRKYHLDHIIPLASFDLTKPEEIKKAFAPENHQWLSDMENDTKGAQWKDSEGNVYIGKRLFRRASS